MRNHSCSAASTLAEHEEHARAVVARDDPRVHVLALVGDLRRSCEVRESFLDLSADDREEAEAHLGHRLRPAVAEFAELRDRLVQLRLGLVGIQVRELQPRGRAGGQCHGCGILVAALGEQALGLAEPADDLTRTDAATSRPTS